MGKAHVGDGGDDFGEEGTGRRVFLLFKFWTEVNTRGTMGRNGGELTLCMLIAESTLSHVGQLDGAL